MPRGPQGCQAASLEFEREQGRDIILLVLLTLLGFAVGWRATYSQQRWGIPELPLSLRWAEASFSFRSKASCVPICQILVVSIKSGA